MSNSKSDLLKELRNLTQAGMKDCKDALEASAWDLNKAVDAVKAKGLQNTSRNEGKVAAEGAVFIALDTDNQHGTMVEVNCQTDFVGNSEQFKKFAAETTLYLSFQDLATFDGDMSKVEFMVADGSSSNVEQYRKETMASTKENVVVRRWFKLDVAGENRAVVQYTHMNNKLGVLLSLEAPSKEALNDTGFKEFAENTAMQIAAMNPVAVSRLDVPLADIERQRAIFETQLREANKPTAAWEKIIAGKFNKWYTDVALLDQESVTTPKMTIEALADELSRKLCGQVGKVKVVDFLRCAVGEGIEVVKTDLAAEVEKLSGVPRMVTPMGGDVVKGG